MRATGAKIRDAACAADLNDVGLAGQQLLGTRGEIQSFHRLVETLRDDSGELDRSQLSGPWHQSDAIFVFLANHAFWLVAGVVVEIFLELALDDAALFFNHQHFALFANEIERGVVGQRPHQADFVDVQAQSMRLLSVDAEQPQRLHQIHVPFAGRDDAVARIGRVKNSAINRIGCGKRKYGCFLGLKTLFDMRSRQVRPADVQPAGRRIEIRDDECGVGRQRNRHCRFHRLGDGLEANPHAGES